MTNIQICPQVGKLLNSAAAAQNTDLLFKQAAHKEKLELLLVGFFWDHWVPAYVLVFPEFVLFFENRVSARRALVVPLYL